MSGKTHFFRGGMKANTTCNNHDTITQIACTKPTDSGCTPMRIRRFSLRSILDHAGLCGIISLICEIVGIRKLERA